MKKKVTCRSPVDLISKQNVIVNVQFIKEQKLKIVWCFLFINNKYESDVQFLLQKRKVKVILDKLSKQRAKVLIVQFSRTECERCFSSCIENKKWKFYRVKGLKLQQSRIMVRSKLHWQRISPYHGSGREKRNSSRNAAELLPKTCRFTFGPAVVVLGTRFSFHVLPNLAYGRSSSTPFHPRQTSLICWSSSWPPSLLLQPWYFECFDQAAGPLKVHSSPISDLNLIF